MTEHLSMASPPRQTRSETSALRILDAARAILLEDGWDGFTIAAVSARAEVSVGLIYQRFGDKDGLFTTVHNSHLAQLERACDEMCGGLESTVGVTPARDAAVAVVTEFGYLFERFGAMNGVMMINSVKVAGLAQIGAGAMRHLQDRISSLLLAVRDSANVRGDPRPGELIVAVAYRMAFASFLDYATYHVYDDDSSVSWPHLIGEVAAAVANYLTTGLHRPQPGCTGGSVEAVPSAEL